jgi:hypothetical protein
MFAMHFLYDKAILLQSYSPPEHSPSTCHIHYKPTIPLLAFDDNVYSKQKLGIKDEYESYPFISDINSFDQA